MEQVVLTLQKPSAIKMNSFLKVMGSNDLFVDNFIDFHINRLKREINRMEIAVSKYEAKYQMNSIFFYQHIQNGDLGDDKDFVMWAGIYEMLLDSKKQLAELL